MDFFFGCTIIGFLKDRFLYVKKGRGLHMHCSTNSSIKVYRRVLFKVVYIHK